MEGERIITRILQSLSRKGEGGGGLQWPEISPPGIINGTGGSNLAIDWYPIQGRVVILLVASCYMKTGISSEWVGK